MFIGRRKELDAMQSLYDKDGFGMMVIYGRRRIGKSTLINEFIKNKNAIFYTATKVGQNRNLELFAKQVISVLDPDFESASFPSTEDIFNFITKKLPDKKIVLVIDELPYWAEKDDSLLSILQKYIFGEVFTVGELDIKTRELLVIALLTTTGNFDTLKSHIEGNLKVGNSKEIIAAAIIQAMPYTGFPNAISALKTLKDVK